MPTTEGCGVDFATEEVLRVTVRGDERTRIAWVADGDLRAVAVDGRASACDPTQRIEFDLAVPRSTAPTSLAVKTCSSDSATRVYTAPTEFVCDVDFTRDRVVCPARDTTVAWIVETADEILVGEETKTTCSGGNPPTSGYVFPFTIPQSTKPIRVVSFSDGVTCATGRFP